MWCKLGASITSISFKTGIAVINNWKLELLGSYPAYLVLPLFGKIPTVDKYKDITKNKIDPCSKELYRYLQFDEIKNFSLSK